jgi:hypothetical protein
MVLKPHSRDPLSALAQIRYLSSANFIAEAEVRKVRHWLDSNHQTLLHYLKVRRTPMDDDPHGSGFIGVFDWLYC